MLESLIYIREGPKAGCSVESGLETLMSASLCAATCRRTGKGEVMELARHKMLSVEQKVMEEVVASRRMKLLLPSASEYGVVRN